MTNEPIITDRLILKAMEKKDAKALLYTLSDRETAWLTDEFVHTNQYAVINFIEWGNDSSEVILYGIFRKESNNVIGYMQIKLPECTGIGDARELGYALSKQYRRRGYMSEAVNAVCDYLFQDEAINRISLEIHNNNLPSLGVAHKCRFSYVDEPIDKKQKRFLDGQPLDLYVRYRPIVEMSSMKYEHQAYPKALRTLARKYNIEIVEKEETAEELAAREHSESLHLVCDRAENFFVESLQSKEGRSLGYQYFRSRGIEDETIAKYGLGWSPSSRHDFTDLAKKEGYKDEYLTDSGLSIKRDDGTLYDRFFERVMFPFHTVSGRIVGFGGRTLRSDNTVAKYVNSPETEIYIKNRILYGLYFAKNEISKQDKCYLVEGYLDVLSMHQAGITNSVATCGISLTDEQCELARRYTENVTIIYDGDRAGKSATIRAISVFLKHNMNPRVILLPDGDDPCSFAQNKGSAELCDFVKTHEQDGIAFKMETLLSKAGTDPMEIAKVINEVTDTIALIPDAVKRYVYVDYLSRKFSIENEIIKERMLNTLKIKR